MTRTRYAKTRVFKIVIYVSHTMITAYDYDYYDYDLYIVSSISIHYDSLSNSYYHTGAVLLLVVVVVV